MWNLNGFFRIAVNELNHRHMVNIILNPMEPMDLLVSTVCIGIYILVVYYRNARVDYRKRAQTMAFRHRIRDALQ